MSLFCQEQNDALCLMLNQSGCVIPAQQLPLPHYVRERVLFWNAWATDEYLNEFERMESALYGLLAYAISIAVDVSVAYPESVVDFCGFPVYDEWATRKYAYAHLIKNHVWDFSWPRVPHQWKYNRAMKSLLAPVKTTPCYVPPHGFVLRQDWDWGYSYFHYDPAATLETWCGYNDSFIIDTVGGYPAWLVEKYKQLEDMHDKYFEEYYEPAEAMWAPSDYIQPFLFDALSVDVARYTRPIVPISSSPRYVTGSALLELVQNLRTS